jgi:membrane protease YdiL (CAAX protease family)
MYYSVAPPSPKRLMLISSACLCLLMIFSILSMFVVAIAISVLRLIFQKLNFLNLQPSDENFWFSLFLFNDLALFLAIRICFRRSFKNQQFFEKSACKKFRIFLYGLIGAIVGFGLLFLFGYLTIIAYGEKVNDPVVTLFYYFSPIYRVLFAILGSLIAPVLEEIFFRRILFGLFRQHDYIKTGIIVSSLLFALAHFSTFIKMGVFYFIGYFFAGLILALIYHKTNTILTSIIAHVLINTTVFLMYFYWVT